MSYYKETEIDRRNFQWFTHNTSCNTLVKIAVNESSIRGLGQFSVDFNYPITVIAGVNGCGKSTILSLASCAFHNNTDFCPASLLSNQRKQRKHYTYSDFFAFTREERGFLQGIKITSTYLAGGQNRTDTRSKTPRGKWKEYDTRPKRAVSFLGINRILPPSESITYRNYCNSFGNDNVLRDENSDLVEFMTRIFGKSYSGVSMRKHKKYRLFGCNRGPHIYTGFNMGAGENAVLQLLHEVISAGSGALIVVDEMELGLHVRAQEKLMQVLKELCLRNCTQIICSSHSSSVIGSVPPEGRILLKPKEGSVEVIYGITPEMAMSELSGSLHSELSVFVEDDVAQDFIQTVLPNSTRRRVVIKILGSADSSLLYAVSTHLREGIRSFVVVMDGDKRGDKARKIQRVVSLLGDCQSISSAEITSFLEGNLVFLPGNEWPEKVIVEALSNSQDLSRLMNDCCVDSIDEMRRLLSTALAAGKHNEFYQLACDLHLDEATIRSSAIRQYKDLETASIQPLLDVINRALM